LLKMECCSKRLLMLKIDVLDLQQQATRPQLLLPP